MPYKERSLYKVYERLQQKALKVGIPPYIIENAKAMYKELSEAQISRGANRRGLMAACIYISCKIEKVPRSAKEVAVIYDLKVSEMTKGCKKFLEIMNLTKTRRNYVMSSSTPLNFIKRFCSKLNINNDIFDLCQIVAFMTTKLDIVDENTPPSIAAGCIFLISSLCNLNIAKKTIAASCKISEVTISKCYKKLYIYRHKLIPKSAIEKYDIKMD
jgi:transcription initiation factor TFIIB